MKQTMKGNKSDTRNKIDMTAEQYNSLTDQAQGTGERLDNIGAYIIQMDTRIDERFTESAKSIDERFKESAKSIDDRFKESVKSIDILRADMRQNATDLRADMRQNATDICEEMRHSLRVMMVLIGVSFTLTGTILMLLMYKSFI